MADAAALTCRKHLDRICCSYGVSFSLKRMASHHNLLMRYVLGYFFSIIFVIFFTNLAAAEQPSPDIKIGRALYERNCARCHGITGAGDGPDAPHLYPRPRNFTLGAYKFRTTASGTPPTEEDVFRTITEGLPGTSMPDWRNLSDEERWQLVSYLQRLSTGLQDVAPQPLTLPPRPQRLEVAKGQRLFRDLGCVQCHGPTGRGNGPSAATLMDDAGQPIVAANLTQGWTYRGGSSVEAILWRMLTGLDGTPMPSYADALSGEDGWHLAAYVHTLQESSVWAHAVAAQRLTGAPLPTTITDPRWEEIPRAHIRLASRVYQQGEVQPTMVHAASLQAVYDAEAIVFRVIWDDRTDTRGECPDVLALVLRPPHLAGHTLTLQNWPLPEAPPLDVCAWSSETARVLEQVGRSLVPLTTGTRLPTQAVFTDGRWSLVFQRPLKSELSEAVALAPGVTIHVALAAYDGGNQEQGRYHASSTWVTLTLRE